MTMCLKKHTQSGEFLMARGLLVAGILAGMLVVPIWLKKGRDHAEKAKEQAIAAPQAAASAAQQTAAEPQGNNPSAFGLTWGIAANDKLPAAAVWMSCHGMPREGITQPHSDSCNPYAGDTSCRAVLPVLCIKKDGSTPESALGEAIKPSRQAISFNDISTDGWAAGSVSSTQPVAGFVIGSLAGANARCEKELGAGWRMAEFHDGVGGQGGWGFVAQRGISLDGRLRHWVHINDQPGNCWNNKG
jgi:hypothetical protein